MGYGEKEFVPVPDVPGEWAGCRTFEYPPRDIDPFGVED